MDQHPIPQDVTGFQFKLIGSMTVKQFGFVAAGIILAVIMWYLPIKGLIAIPIKMLLIPLLGVSGIIIAFIPIEGRPADVMASNFIKALFAPNQFVYRREGRQFSFSKVATITPAAAQAAAEAAQRAAEAQKMKALNTKDVRLQAFLYGSTEKQAKNALDKKEMDFFKNISSLSAATTAPSMTQPINSAVITAAPTPTPLAPNAPLTTKIVPTTPHMVSPTIQAVSSQPMTMTATPLASVPAPQSTLTPPTVPPTQIQPPHQETPEELGKEEATLQEQITAAKKEETTAAPSDTNTIHQKVLELEKKMQEIHEQKLQLEQELMKAKTQTAVPSPAPSATTAQPGVRVVPQTAQRSAGLPHIPDTPNVVVGIVKDPRGNVLSNILVEIKDKDNNPVRAFKTNALGHFASATPLATGIYTIELEDPKKQNRFDVIQLVANNQILLPLEIISHDAREELRKQLFN